VLVTRNGLKLTTTIYSQPAAGYQSKGKIHSMARLLDRHRLPLVQQRFRVLRRCFERTMRGRYPKVLRNDFPSTFAAQILCTTAGERPIPYTIDLNSTSASASAASSQHRQGSRSDPTHIVLPLSGKLVEVLVDVGDLVKKDQAVCVVKQMKMEIEVRSHKSGIVTWTTEAEDDEEVAEGMLAVIVEDEKAQAKL